MVELVQLRRGVKDLRSCLGISGGILLSPMFL